MNSYLGGDNINKKDIIKENNEILDKRIWTQKRTILSDKIFPQIAYRSNIVKKLLAIYLNKKMKKIQIKVIYIKVKK